MNGRIGSRIGILLLLAMASVCRADTIDDAEAKKQGITTQQAETTKLQARIADLEKQVAALKKENADLKIAAQNATADASKARSNLGPSTDFSEAIKTHRLVIGMTIDDAKAAFPTVGQDEIIWAMDSDATTGQTYICHWYQNAPITLANGAKAARQIDLGDLATAHFINGRIDYADVNAKAVANWQRLQKPAN